MTSDINSTSFWPKELKSLTPVEEGQGRLGGNGERRKRRRASVYHCPASLCAHLHETKHLSSPDLVPRSSPSAGDTAVKKQTKIPALVELTF